MKRLYCKTLLQQERWRKDVVMTLAANGMIKNIEPGKPQEADACIHGVAVPGMPNVHSHSFQRLIAGRSSPGGNHNDSFWSWRETMYRCANRVTPQQLGAAAAWVFVEMLKAGYTSCAEFHYIHHKPGGAAYNRPEEMSARLVRAASASGIAMTLLPVLYCNASFAGAAPTPAQQRFANTAPQYLRLLEACQNLVSGYPLIELGLAPHSLRAVPAGVLHEVLQSWSGSQCPVHIHIAEQPAEVETCESELGLRPLEYLLQEFAVDQHWCVIHATHMTPGELIKVAASGVVAGLCPTTEADLGDGVFATADWLQAGGNFAIGSDSNVRISVAEELRMLEYNARAASGERNVLTLAEQSCGRFLYQHAALAGGIALGQPVGCLEPGYRADLLELDSQHELLTDKDPDSVMDSWIFAGDRSMIRSVRVAGRQLIINQQHAREHEMRQAFKGAREALQSK